MTLGRLIARVAIGGLFVGHGTQKLFGWFGGPGVEGASQMMRKLELHPPRRNAMAAGAAETTAGVLLALGALTPVAGALVTSTMVTAIRKVHGPNGPWIQQSGYEYNAVLIAVMAALVEAGPGAPSVDRALGIEKRGTGWALAAIAAGAAGSTLAIEAGRRIAADEVASQPNQGATGRFVREGDAVEAEPAPAAV
ncbi:MAG TPA: DoxX family protein [Thermoleophilaceae bacterium]|nr:DoxX family protein [Thermoleophilaceae bacterium]